MIHSLSAFMFCCKCLTDTHLQKKSIILLKKLNDEAFEIVKSENVSVIAIKILIIFILYLCIYATLITQSAEKIFRV